MIRVSRLNNADADLKCAWVRRQGQQRIYSLDPAGLAELRSYIESFWEQVLDSYQDAAIHSTQQEDLDV